MKLKLLIIDPQNDFCDGGALQVPGASADLWRLAHFIKEAAEHLSEVLVTLDSHPQVAIERVSFWVDSEGHPLAPFTEVTEEAVRQRRYLPKNAAHTPRVLEYLQVLEARGRHRLIVWPVHCVLGTEGHAIYAPLAVSLADWETKTQRPVLRVLKGLNPMTEQYSAIAAEVPVEEDPSTLANRQLIDRARPAAGELLVIAGEASSHCVRETVLDLMKEYGPAQHQRMVLLTDCMSPVTGFEGQSQAFFSEVSAKGVALMKSRGDGSLLDTLQDVAPAAAL